jgi:MFS family permease
MSSETSTSADSRAQDDGFLDQASQREFWIVALASLLFSITATHSPLVAVAFGRLGYSLEQIGVVLSIIALPVIASTFCSGLIIGRFGALGAMRISMLLGVVGVGSMALTSEAFWPSLASRLLWGVGVGFFLPPTMVYIQSRLSQKRFVYLVSAFSATVPLGLAFAPAIGEFTLNHFGVAAMFATGALPAVFAFALTFALRPLAKPMAGSGLGVTAAARRWHLFPVLALFIGGAHYGYAASYLSPALEHAGTALGWFFIPLTFAMVFSRVGAMRKLSAYHPRLLATGGLLMTSIALVVAAWSASPAFALMAGLLLGMGNSMMYPVISAWMGRGCPPAQRGGVQAIAATAFYGGIYATPWPETYMVAGFGYSATQALLGLIGVAMAAALAGSKVDGG